MKPVFIGKNLSNTEIQNILDSLTEKVAVIFSENSYDNISLIVNKPVLIRSGSNSILNGQLNQTVITVNVENTEIENLIIVANKGSGILINNSKNVEIQGNKIYNKLNESLIKNYQNGTVLMLGNSVEIYNSYQVSIVNNKISYFFNGVYLENTTKTEIKNNLISKNNYGITLGLNVSKTLIKNNTIIDNIGRTTMDVVEGPLGYGIFSKDSGVDLKITGNIINNNYIGIYLNAPNSTEIVIIKNEITQNVLEGLDFNENYTFEKNAIQPLIENNAIYNNAKGPGMIVLGEVSANPNGIYGPGEWNNTLKLKLGSNWYGTNKYTQWGNETQGAGTICPRINTTLIIYNITCISPGTYKVIFYNNGLIATALPDFTTFFTLNFLTEYEEEVKVLVHEGVGTFTFQKNSYLTSGNLIEGSNGSLSDSNRIYYVISTYNVPESEIPK